jgi:outer membrane protein assembly factor BamE (lipoprotein component of BamABCDE complex)
MALRLIFSILFTIALNGCLSNNVLMSSANAQTNVENLSTLQIGMTKDEVFEVMRYPSTEDRILIGEDRYDVWFYVTRANILDQRRYVSRNLTPVIFKNDVYIGMGYEYYKKLLQHVKTTNELPPLVQPQKIEKLNPVSPEEAPPPDIKKEEAITMSRKPKKEEASKPFLDEEDEDMLDGAREENFNDW